MDLIRPHPIRRFSDGRWESRPDAVVGEIRVELDVNDGQYRLAMLCLPRDLDAVAVGFLWGEGVLTARTDLHGIDVSAEDGVVRLRGDFDAAALASLSRRWTWGTGCGGGGTGHDVYRPDLVAVGPGPTVQPEQILALVEAFQSRAALWRQTGAVHACGLADAQRIVLFAEDVGRHNAFDKVMGRALLDGIGVSDKLVLTTGRLSAEIVSKAATCRVPILASRSAVTSLGIRLARRLNMTLVGFVRGRRLNVYTAYQRVGTAASPEGGSADGA